MQQNGVQLGTDARMFLSLVEQLSRPLLQIARLSELAQATAPLGATEAAAQWQAVQAIADGSLQLAESYALSLRLHGQVAPLQVEPIAVSALLYDAAQTLTPLARHYAVELQLDSGPKMRPILGDRTLLQSALVSLGQVFVMAQAEADEPAPVRLSAHRSRYGVVAGLYGNQPELGADSLRRAQSLGGSARQPLQKLISGPAAGVFVADSLLRALSARLHVARYHKLTGLAATLTASQQLELI